MRDRTDPLGLGELLHGLLQVAEGSLHQALVLLEVVQQHIPQGLLGQHLGVTQDDQPILGSGQCHVQTPWVTQEPNALQYGPVGISAINMLQHRLHNRRLRNQRPFWRARIVPT